jgi:hypothetical protein
MLEVEDPAELITILDDVQVCDWVVYIQPPPQETSDPEDVLKYLARYMDKCKGSGLIDKCKGSGLIDVSLALNTES